MDYLIKKRPDFDIYIERERSMANQSHVCQLTVARWRLWHEYTPQIRFIHTLMWNMTSLDFCHVSSHVREADLEQIDFWFQVTGFLYSSSQVDNSRVFSGLLIPWSSELINIVIACELHFLIFWCHRWRWNNLYWVVNYDLTFHSVKRQIDHPVQAFAILINFSQTKQRPHSSTLHEARSGQSFIPPMRNKWSQDSKGYC